MAKSGGIVLILGSGPSVVRSRVWPRAHFDTIVAINNAWAVRTDWDMMVYPEDFPLERRPVEIAPNQQMIGAEEFVPAQNRFGGFVFAGGTMAFTAAYWVLDALRPRVMAFLGCDMVYPANKQTHFYGTGVADPLRDDLTLRDLGAKSARLGMIAAAQGCACVNLSDQAKSTLLFDRGTPAGLSQINGPFVDMERFKALRDHEAALEYDTHTGRYWEEADRFDPAVLDAVDRDWRALFADHQQQAEWDKTRADQVAASRYY